MVKHDLEPTYSDNLSGCSDRMVSVNVNVHSAEYSGSEVPRWMVCWKVLDVVQKSMTSLFWQEMFIIKKIIKTTVGKFVFLA